MCYEIVNMYLIGRQSKAEKVEREINKNEKIQCLYCWRRKYLYIRFFKIILSYERTVPIKKLVLFDIDAERQEPIGEFGKILFKEQFPELDFSYTTDIKEAYEGMDFVFMQMRAGGLPMRAKDEHIPLSMGLIGQETCGAGGMAYGLRSCVDMIKAVHDIRNYAPEAWILNYSNPAAIVAEALRREFPDDKKILNICDQPENVVRSCSRLLGCDWENLDPVYFGLNHYGWFTNIYDIKTGEDLLPKLRELIKKMASYHKMRNKEINLGWILMVWLKL